MSTLCGTSQLDLQKIFYYLKLMGHDARVLSIVHLLYFSYSHFFGHSGTVRFCDLSGSKQECIVSHHMYCTNMQLWRGIQRYGDIQRPRSGSEHE